MGSKLSCQNLLGRAALRYTALQIRQLRSADGALHKSLANKGRRVQPSRSLLVWRRRGVEGSKTINNLAAHTA